MMPNILQCAGQVSAAPSPEKNDPTSIVSSAKAEKPSSKGLDWELALSLHARKPVTLLERPCKEATWNW